MDLIKILFIGNSYTYFNDLPGMLQDLAQAAGKPLETAAVTSGGKSLEWHLYSNPATLDAIDKGGWSFVVLQDYSLQTITDPDKMRSAATSLAARICKVGATPVLYLTWARQHIPEMQDTITKMYVQIACEIDARVAPVGEAWRKVRAAEPALVLHTEDRSHPNILGSYLTACVFYAIFFKETPVGLPATFGLCNGVRAVVDKGKAALLQEMAWASIQELNRESGEI
ncbi:MAG: SGNH/GDSL hydrolase family protein [Anaerolineae bacterium]|nr:SGNH/GDSL hydrolase family protein [Anaerolineae bacterium]